MKNNTRARLNRIINQIRATREGRNFTQDYLAFRMNVSQNTYSRIELGHSRLTLARLIEICSILEVPLQDMIDPDRPVIPYLLVMNPALQRR